MRISGNFIEEVLVQRMFVPLLPDRAFVEKNRQAEMMKNPLVALGKDLFKLLAKRRIANHPLMAPFARALGKRNDVYCASIEHKLGIHGSPTCVLAYGDGPTPFLLDAQMNGLAIQDGRRMLMEQGAASFEYWWDMPAPRDVMMAAIQ